MFKKLLSTLLIAGAITSTISTVAFAAAPYFYGTYGMTYGSDNNIISGRYAWTWGKGDVIYVSSWITGNTTKESNWGKINGTTSTSSKCTQTTRVKKAAYSQHVVDFASSAMQLKNVSY